VSAVPQRVIRGINAALVRTKLRREPPDIVHETYYMRSRLAPPRTKTIVTIHDMIHEKFPQYFPARDMTSQCKKAAVQRAERIICVSENTRADLLDILEVDPEKVSVVHHGSSAGGARPIATKLTMDPPYVAFVGTRVGYKNFDRLLEAFGMSDFLRHDFAIMCFGGGEFTEDELSRAAKLGIDRERLLHSKGNDETLHQVYREAAAFVYPSLYEGFGLPTLEAMSNECPVICSNTSSLPEVCGDAAEYFDPNSAESIAASIEKVLNSPSLREELVNRGLQRIKSFSWQRCAEQTANVYKLACAGEH
jgi:glycosyltransferase involved in cell wall biosynthesis